MNGNTEVGLSTHKDFKSLPLPKAMNISDIPLTLGKPFPA